MKSGVTTRLKAICNVIVTSSASGYIGYTTVAHVYHAVTLFGKAFIVGNNDKCLSHVAAQVEKEPVKLVAVMGVKATRRFIGNARHADC